jgi:hypothetical protein
VFSDRLRYELKLMGNKVLITPVALVIILTMLAFILRLGSSKITTVTVSNLEMFLPLLAGIIVATICMHDSAIELQLTFPALYSRTVWSRVGLVTGWMALVSCILSIIFYLLHPQREPIGVYSWPMMLQIFLGQLTWLAPLSWVVALTLVLALQFRSRATSIAVLGALWVGENIVYGLFLSTFWLRPIFLFATTLTPLQIFTLNIWLQNRLCLIGIGLVFLLIAGWRLRNTEALLPSSSGGDE